MLRVARRKNRSSNLAFQTADATELPFEDTSFDAACISFALHEMPPSVRESALREMARVTRSGGKVLFVDYALPANRVARSVVYLNEGRRRSATLPDFIATTSRPYVHVEPGATMSLNVRECMLEDYLGHPPR